MMMTTCTRSAVVPHRLLSGTWWFVACGRELKAALHRYRAVLTATAALLQYLPRSKAELILLICKSIDRKLHPCCFFLCQVPLAEAIQAVRDK
jgi:hypothetical protein